LLENATPQEEKPMKEIKNKLSKTAAPKISRYNFEILSVFVLGTEFVVT